MGDKKITYRDPATLHGRQTNPRKHTTKQVRKIANSIWEFGFQNPVLVDSNDTIIAGHGRVEAAKLVGLDRIPTIRVDDLTEAQVRAYVIADNRLAELANWDEPALSLEFKAIMDLDINLDLTLTGFDTPDLDIKILGDRDNEVTPETVSEPDPKTPTVSEVGDLWSLGAHRLLCGDARDPACFDVLMCGDRARTIFTDPPYNVPIQGHVSGLGKIKHDEFAMASGEMTSEIFSAFLETTLGHMANHSVNGALHFVCMDWRHIDELLVAGRSLYQEVKNLCVWNKNNGGMGSLYRSKHELVFVFKIGSAPHVNNIELGRHGRYRTNVWDYPGVNTLRPGRLEELHLHPTVKPVAMVADALIDTSNRGEIVLDCFGGSGSMLIAAERTGRCARVMEIDPRYVDVTIRRWQCETGETAVLAETNEAFDDVAERRYQPTTPRKRKAKRGVR